jgi:hypothetical protein
MRMGRWLLVVVARVRVLGSVDRGMRIVAARRAEEKKGDA